MAITYTTKKYKIIQKTSETTADILHPVSQADIVLIQPFSDITAKNTQKALEQLNDKITVAQSSVLYNTKAGWDSQPTLRTQANILYVYTDAFIYNDGTQDIVVAGIKVGDGNAYLIDKPFLSDYLAYEIGELNDSFQSHLDDNVRHITNEERSKWNNKLNVDLSEISNETLIFNKN